MLKPEPHRLIIEEREGYLFAHYGGNPLTLEMILETINRVATLIRERGYRNVLLVRDAPLLESDENRALIANLINTSVRSPVRFAIVDEYGNDPEKVRKAVEASRRAGWDLTGFKTIEDAERWLTS